MNRGEIAYKKRRDNRKNKDYFPQYTSKSIRVFLEIFCYLKSKFGKRKIFYFFEKMLPFIIIIVVLLFIIRVLIIFIFEYNKFGIDKEKQKIEKLNIELSSPSQQFWLRKVSDFKIERDNETCDTFKLSQIELDIKQGFHNIKFQSNRYILDKIEVDTIFQELNGLEHVLEIIYDKYDIDTLWFFAKGYADTSDNLYKNYSILEDYAYSKIKFYKLDKPKKIYTINNRYMKDLILKNHYKNEDLIYLRSSFVKDVIFKDFETLIDVKNKKFGILEGNILDVKNKDYRRVDIYITFCKENSIW